MKILRLTPGASAVAIHADSAIAAPRQPFFIPDWGSGWVADWHLAVRMSRLGKCIAEKFAGRYFDALAAAAWLRPASAGPDIPGGMLMAADSTVALGDWLDPLAHTGSAGVWTPGAIAQTVSRLSEYMTFKTGDVLLLPLGEDPSALESHSWLTREPGFKLKVI